MPIFGAKSRAARSCASKLACGRRIDPHDTRPFLTIRCGKFAIAPRADRVVRPYRTFCVSAEHRAILQLPTAGESAASTPTDVLCFRRTLCDSVIASRAGGVEPRPYADLIDFTGSPRCVLSRKKILPPHIHGTRASLLRGATQVQRDLPSLVCRLFRGGVRRFRRGAPYTRARRMSFAPAAGGSFQHLLPSLTGVRRYCFRVTAMMNF